MNRRKNGNKGIEQKIKRELVECFMWEEDDDDEEEEEDERRMRMLLLLEQTQLHTIYLNITPGVQTPCCVCVFVCVDFGESWVP